MERPKPNSKAEFFECEKQAWDELNGLVAGLPAKMLKMPGAAGEWSVKDVWAHLADWMEHTRKAVPRIMQGEKVKAEIQAFNEAHHEKNEARTLTATRERLARERKLFLAFVKRLPEEQLLGNPRVYSWVSFSCYNHYAEHIPGFRQFREISGTAGNTEGDGSR